MRQASVCYGTDKSGKSSLAQKLFPMQGVLQAAHVRKIALISAHI